MSSDWISAISAFGQVLIGVGTFVLSYVLWKGSERKAKTEYMRSIQEGWNGLNALILSNPELAVISDEVLFAGQSIKQENKERLKRYMQYKILNILESEYLGRNAGLISDNYHHAISKDIMEIMLKDDDLLSIIKRSGFHAEFVSYCDELAESIKTKVEQGEGLPGRPESAG